MQVLPTFMLEGSIVKIWGVSSLIAALPGTYTAPASRAYLYYTDVHKHWIPGPRVEITPRAEN